MIAFPSVLQASMGRSGSLGAPSASSLPAPSASLSRGVSLPQPSVADDTTAPHAGSPPWGSHHAGGGHRRRGSSAHTAAGSRPDSKQADHDSGSPSDTQHLSHGSTTGTPQLHRSASAEAPRGPAQPNGQPMAPARTLKLEKDDVMR